MTFLGVNNILTKIVLVNLLIHFYYVEAVNHTQTSPDDEEEVQETTAVMEELEDSHPRSFGVFGFLSSINGSLGEIVQKIISMETLGAQRHQEVTSKIALIESKIESNSASMSTSLARINERINALETAGDRKHKDITLRISENFACVGYVQTDVTDCGGNVEILPGMASTIHYPKEGNYSNNERCVWNIHPTNETSFDSYRMKINALSMEKGYDGIVIYFWNSTGELQSQKITTFGEWIFIKAPNLVMTFCSDGSYVGAGFQAIIAGVGNPLDRPQITNVWLSNPTETYSYSVASDNYTNAEVRVVVQPTHDRPMKVKMTSNIFVGDSIKLYELTCGQRDVNNYQLIARQSEDGEWTENARHSTINPIFGIFRGKSASSFDLNFESII